LVVDGTEAILGGINWGNKYAFGGVKPKAWRDSDVYLSGSVVASIQRQFVRDLFLYRAMDTEYSEKNKNDFSRKEHYQSAINDESKYYRRESRQTVSFIVSHW
jgi:phosphatidylserine/phosphatidylglycerophosphate/cardiolipin synthase-like enzyme